MYERLNGSNGLSETGNGEYVLTYDMFSNFVPYGAAGVVRVCNISTNRCTLVFVMK